MTDFFISYTQADATWAEWIAYVLEEEGFTTVIQAWDFRPGSNFVLEMQKAAGAAERTIMILSSAYLGSAMGASEWAGAFATDPQGQERRLVPVMVETCEPKGLLPQIVQIRLLGLDENTARAALLKGVNKTRAKPPVRPTFPGITHAEAKDAPFPGPPAAALKSPLLPPLSHAPTDADRRRFMKEAFFAICQTFEERLRQADAESKRVEVDFTRSSEVDFEAEIYLDGKSLCRCRIWIGGIMGRDSISFNEGATAGNACNEMLTSAQNGGLGLSATMAMGYLAVERGREMSRLTTEEASDYLWARFTAPLGRPQTTGW